MGDTDLEFSGCCVEVAVGNNNVPDLSRCCDEVANGDNKDPDLSSCAEVETDKNNGQELSGC